MKVCTAQNTAFASRDPSTYPEEFTVCPNSNFWRDSVSEDAMILCAPWYYIGSEILAPEMGVGCGCDGSEGFIYHDYCSGGGGWEAVRGRPRSRRLISKRIGKSNKGTEYILPC
jgi:hypothetical protein